MSQAKTIDIDKVLQSKLGSRARWVPSFLVRYLKRIVHQDWLNAFIRQEGSVVGVQWLKDCMRYVNLNIRVEGMEHLPSDADGSRFTFVANHPLGGADGVIIGAVLGEHYEGRIRLLVNDLLMHLEGLAPLCIAVNKTGRQDRHLPRRIDEAFRSDNHMFIFPAGVCSREIDGHIQDLPWSKTFITKSIETHRDVIPIHFEGRNSAWFYRLANWSKHLGLKFNLAMLYLADELYKHQGSHFTLKIGKPIPWQNFTAERSPSEWAAVVREEVYKLK
ncbi:MAG: glycerol acyltransferase [Bacteroidales bacterium]|nr:glycerol acyltransferase [Bacteroidales bacterium]